MHQSQSHSLGGLEEPLGGVRQELPVVDDGVRLRKLAPVDNYRVTHQADENHPLILM